MPLDLHSLEPKRNFLQRWLLPLRAKQKLATQSDEPSLRAELFSDDQLGDHAKTLARWHTIAKRGGQRCVDTLLPRLKDNEALLREAYGLVAQAVQSHRRITPAAEWFLDNYHLIEGHIRTARRHLPKGFNCELPRLGGGPHAGCPRVYAIALELIAHVDGRVDGERIHGFVASYQTVAPLKIGELWAIPIMLRLALIENLRRVAVSIAAGRRDRELAAKWAGRMAEVAAKSPTEAVSVLAEMAAQGPRLSPAFITEFSSRMHGRGANMAFPVAWLEQRVAEQGQTLEGLRLQASQSQAADQVSIGNSIGSLRFLDAMEWRNFVESLSATERVLHTDPSGVYPCMDFATRDQYRHAIEAIAKGSLLAEEKVAQLAVDLAGPGAASKAGGAGDQRLGHVGYFLIGKGRRALETAAGIRPRTSRGLCRLCRCFPMTCYGGTVVLLTACLTAIALWWAAGHGFGLGRLIALGLLLALSLSQLAVSLTNWAMTMLIRPRALPRMDFSQGIPADCLTVVAVPTMITDIPEIDDLTEALEVRFLANRDANLFFVLLTDFADAKEQVTPEDAGLLKHAMDGINGLNAKYPGGHFFLFHRARRWNKGENAWMGWERKRGKLEDFNHALRGETARFHTIVGDAQRLQGARYVITLDSDTRLPRDSAKKLVGTMAHPLNRPIHDAKRGRVTEGYGILQPRVGISMSSANRSPFARLFAGDPGIDPYTNAVSDVYQDLLGEGSFVGKGIYDLDTFQSALGRRLPENHVLSHDLLESAYARSGLVSDVLLFEDYPSSYPADVSRCCRWMRGDWQIAPWLFSLVPGAQGWMRNPLSCASQWKIMDNLRRSLVPVALLALLATAWFSSQAALPGTLLVLLILLLPALIGTLAQWARKPAESQALSHARTLGSALLRQTWQQGFVLACLPYEAVTALGSIGRAAVRLLITKRHLLEWRTARDAQRSALADLAHFYTTMWPAPVAAGCVWMMLGCLRPEAMVVAAPILGLWLCAPAIAFRLSQTTKPVAPRLSASDVAFLGMAARRTWQFFEAFVGPEDHFLPPDNFQEKPSRGLAHRTSPTNIGISLLANLAAYDFGFIPAEEVALRTSQTLDTLDKLERHRGHFYNWYDTRTLAPLHPLYVSTVDSGNLAGHLLVLAVGLEELASSTASRLPLTFSGLGSALDLLLDAARAPMVSHWQDLVSPMKALRESLRLPPSGQAQAQTIMRQVAEAATGLSTAMHTSPDCDLKWWAAALERQCRLCAQELNIPAQAALAQRSETLCLLAARCRAFADAMEYAFLYDEDRHLLHIGYNATDHRLDAGFYDLLASEARLVSFVAIAQGKLPQENWFSLDRTMTNTGGDAVLLSWSGSMFEYLMPLLVMPTCKHTLLDDTYEAVVRRQIAYGRERGIPWGISECGYTKTDAQLNYQYRAFGVPGLGFKRGLADELVMAPYASAMALMVAPEAACANLRRLAREGRLGLHGFYEAVDYAAGRLPRGQESAVVRSYMAHHQGMVFLSLLYLLRDRPMQRRFEADRSFAANSLLLQERIPKTPAVFPHPAEASQDALIAAPPEVNYRVFATPNTPAPEAHLLSNGRYHLCVTASGGGYSRWHELAVTRWREDPTRDGWGTFCYVRDTQSGEFWSAASQPTPKVPALFEAVFSQGRAEFRRRDGDLETHTEISVSPEDDIELRRISLTNRGRFARTIELTSYAEVVMAAPAADAAHPAFGNLFVQTELARQRQAVLCTRRPRSEAEKPPWMLHLMTVHGDTCAPTSYETSRRAFIGRGRTLADPAAMYGGALSGAEGPVLDPIVSIRNTVTIEPDQTVRIHLVTGMADTREGALALAEKYHGRPMAERVFELAWTHSQAMLHHLEATVTDAQLYGRLAGAILYANPLLRARESVLLGNRRGQSGLWAYGISGDFPIVLLRIGDGAHLSLARQLVQAHAYWRMHGLVSDLIIWNEDQSGYRQQLQDELLGVIASSGESGRIDKPGGIFIRRIENISEEDKVLMQSVARVVVSDSAGTLAQQMDRMGGNEIPIPKLRAIRPRRLEPAPRLDPAMGQKLAAFNGCGGFSADGTEYVITTTADKPTPAPWVNVIANPWLGTVVSESGSSYTWCENAHAFRLTPWSNDAVCDTCGEAFYIRDDETGRFWSPTPAPARGPAPYTTRHGFGYSVFETSQDGITSSLQVHVAADAPVKIITLKVRNNSGRARQLSATGFFELVMGDRRETHATHVVTEVDPKTSALFARNFYNGEFSQRVAFLDTSEAVRSLTGDRREFIGRNGRLADPACLSRARLSGRVGAGLDPCAAMQVALNLADGQEREIAFAFGAGRDLADARQVVARFRGMGPARASFEGVRKFWAKTLGTVRVETPDESVNFLANGWLLYQTISSRLWGRSGFYQSGGAFGFRDQLQDAMALVHARPALLRAQLLLCASRQFREGDAQHWWHPPAGRGVRTHISDDYLWLPYAACRYVAAIGDTGVLDEPAGFLTGRPLKPEEESYYDLPGVTEESATLYEHCVRAIKHGLRFGEHGLPLMGCGDWNDGMNLVGAGGKGESVWLAFFLHDVLAQFAPLARGRGDLEMADLCQAEAEKLRLNIEEHGWDGQWYRRAYFDDGQPLGSASNAECRIDSLPQSWAVLTGSADPARARQAMAQVDAQLVKPDTGIIQLFDPPFDQSHLNPGYIKGYVPGVRENGGQYTHAAIWFVMAHAAAGDNAKAWELFQLINPVRHGDSKSAIAKYKVEPYVVAADVYGNPQHAGQGGWTWYTGSAGWMYRLITESLLGLRLEADQLRFTPCLPAAWKNFKIHYRFRDTVYHIAIRNLGGGKTVKRLVIDGVAQPGGILKMSDDRQEHAVEMEVD